MTSGARAGHLRQCLGDAFAKKGKDDFSGSGTRTGGWDHTVAPKYANW